MENKDLDDLLDDLKILKDDLNTIISKVKEKTEKVDKTEKVKKIQIGQNMNVGLIKQYTDSLMLGDIMFY